MKLCISTVIEPTYQHFAPIFLYCLGKQYPEYHVKLLGTGDLNKSVKQALELVDMTNVAIDTNYFNGWRQYKYSPISWRFCVSKEEYTDYDFVYITDIDMMILREKVELLHFHINEMSQTGLSYSNSVRNAKHWKGQQSVSGLHFASYEFFEKTEKRMLHYAQKIKSGEVGQKREYDGNMLYRIIKESGLGMCKKYPLVDRHHGIHLGNFRIYGTKRKSKLKKRIDRDKCVKWVKMLEDDVFQEIIGLCSADSVVKGQVNALNNHCRRMVK